MLFNEQEMLSLCSEMGIDLVDNNECTELPIVDSSLFDFSTLNNCELSDLKDCEFAIDEMVLLAS